MYYVLDHFYAVNHMDYCRVVQSDRENIYEVAQLLAAIQFYFEDNVSETDNPALDDVIKLLEKHYGFKAVDKESVKNSLRYIIDVMLDLHYECCAKLDFYGKLNFEDSICTYIDMYEIRESMCGTGQPDKLYNKWLTPEVKEEIKRLPCA